MKTDITAQNIPLPLIWEVLCIAVAALIAAGIVFLGEFLVGLLAGYQEKSQVHDEAY